MIATSGLLDAAWELGPELVADRRYLHQHPELGFQEEHTARFIAGKLRALGLEVQTGVAGTGVVALLRGGKGDGRCVLLRADIDALPMDELNDVPYKSGTAGVMHACGHDAHAAILLGVAKVLTARRGEFAGAVKFVFQPSEEAPPGGARPMIAAGVLEEPHVDASFGVHMAQQLPAGTIGIADGPMAAAPDGFVARVRGVGGHAALPHLAVDPIVIAAQCVVALQTLVSREVNPLRQVVITVGSFHAGTVSNIIPPEAVFEATVRTFDPAVRRQMAERVPTLVKGLAAALRGEAEVEYSFGYPPVINDAALSALVREVAVDLVGAERVVAMEPGMYGDDMAYFLERAPGCYFSIGTNNPARGLVYGHHHPRFDIDDEQSLPVGVGALAGVALRYLASDE